MKKLITISIFLLFLLSNISAIEFDMKKEFKSGETLMAKVSGNFIDQITSEDIYFYREHVAIPFVYDVTKIQEEFYIYALLPEIEEAANYSLRIKDVQYKEGSKIIEEEIIKNFTILPNQTADFSISPGFIKTNKDFSILVQNLIDEKIELEITSQDNLELKSGDIKKINFAKEDFPSSSLETITFKTDSLEYNIPLYIDEEVIIKQEDKEDTEPEEQEPKQEYVPETLQTCEEIQGTVCKENEKCKGDSVDALDTKCCLDECEEIESDMGWKLVGWLLIIIILTLAYWFYTKKYKNTQKKFSFADILKKKE